MRVFIVRHGETNWNLEGRIQGISDVPLNATGLEQAQKIANRLRLQHFDAIFTSPLKRAKQTAELIAQFHSGTPFYSEPNLREVSFGTAEGLTWKEIAMKYPYECRPKTPQEEFVGKFPEGDSVEERVEALIPVVEKWKQQYQGKTILLSTHGYIKRALLMVFGMISFEKSSGMRFGNTALTILKPFDVDQIELLNDTSHL